MRKKFPNGICLNSRGQSLTSVLMAAGIGAIVMASFSTMMVSQQRVQKHLAQKYELMDLKQNLLTSFQNANVCKCNLRPNQVDWTDSTNKHFDATTWDDSSTINDETDGRIELTSLKAGCSSTSPDIATVNQKLPGSQTGIVVEKIKLKNLQPTDPAAAANLRLEWQGFWEISFKTDSSSSPVPPVRIAQKFKVRDDATTSPETSRKIDICIATNFGPSGAIIPNFLAFDSAGDQTWVVPLGVTKIIVEAWGGGGGGSTNGDSIAYYDSGCINHYADDGGIPPNNVRRLTGSGSQGNGGGGGGYAKGSISVVPGDTITFHVGAGGAGGTGACNAPTAANGGTDGENSTILGIVASGGQRGTWGCQTIGSPGTGGTANVGLIVNSGTTGGWGGYWAIGGTFGGAAGGPGGGGSIQGNGVAPGGGGSGGGSGVCAPAPHGANGRVIIYW